VLREHTYSPAWWVPGPHLRTMWGRLTRRRLTTPVRVERWTTPDDDVLELRRLDPPAGTPATTPHLVFLHGLEGGVHSHYVANLFAEAVRHGWGADLVLFRGCAGELNHTRRFYHSGETTDFDFALRRIIAERPAAPIGLAGISLGGNVLLKWLAEHGGSGDSGDGGADDTGVPQTVRGAVAVSVPFDLARGCRHLSRGFSRVYERFFLRSLVAKARQKLAHHPDLCDPAALDRVRTLWEFDDVVTAPVHGFRDALDYYTQSSSIHYLSRVRTPTLLLSALDDPFLPPEVLDEVQGIARENPALETEFVQRGGHVGFISGRVPWRPVYYAEWRVAEFLASRFAERRALSGSATASLQGVVRNSVHAGFRWGERR
jgi:predicted alpha/beta-fold hydrolase